MSAVERPAGGPGTEHGQPPITVSAEWVHRLFESAQYMICVPPTAREVEWLVRDLHGRLTRLLHERSELEKRLAESRSAVAAMRSAGDELAEGAVALLPALSGHMCPASATARGAEALRVLDAWRSAAGSPTTDGGDF